MYHLTNLDKHNSMLNVTSHIAVRLQNLPDWNVDWADSRPQHSRESLTISNYLPRIDDSHHLKKRATVFLMEVLATEFTDLSDFKSFVHKRQSSHPVRQSEVVPMNLRTKSISEKPLTYYHN